MLDDEDNEERCVAEISTAQPPPGGVARSLNDKIRWTTEAWRCRLNLMACCHTTVRKSSHILSAHTSVNG